MYRTSDSRGGDRDPSRERLELSPLPSCLSSRASKTNRLWSRRGLSPPKPRLPVHPRRDAPLALLDAPRRRPWPWGNPCARGPTAFLYGDRWLFVRMYQTGNRTHPLDNRRHTFDTWRCPGCPRPVAREAMILPTLRGQLGSIPSPPSAPPRGGCTSSWFSVRPPTCAV